MSLVRINADTEGGLAPGAGELARHLAELPEGAPVVVLIHGYKFSPAAPRTCPHTHILADVPDTSRPRAVSWPRHLGFRSGAPAEGLCIAFGWEARGTIWQAYARAERAGRALAALIAGIDRPVDIVAHSLGARVALAAFAGLPPGAIGRAILLAGAEFRDTAARALATPAGRTAEIVSVTSRENAVFDLMFERMLRPADPFARALGAGLDHPGWLTLALDCDATRAHLAGLGFPIPAPTRRVCHWSAYLRPGVFPLYRALLRDRARLPLASLRAPEAERAPAPRNPVTLLPLSFRRRIPL